MKLEVLYSKLKRIHLSEGLAAIGAINACMKYDTGTLFTLSIPIDVIELLKKRGRTEKDRLALAINFSKFARYLLLSNANDHKGEPINFRSKDFFEIYNMIVNIDGFTDQKHPDEFLKNFLSIFSRIAQSQFPIQGSIKTLIGRGFYINYMLLCSGKYRYDFPKKFEEYFGITIFEFLSTGFVIWSFTNGTIHPSFAEDIPKCIKGINKYTVQKFLELSSGNPLEYKKHVRGESAYNMDLLRDVFALEPLYFMPAIPIVRSLKLNDGTFVIPQCRFLLDRTTMGIFHLLSNEERKLAAPSGRGNKFRDEFGSVYRTYVKDLLSQTKIGSLVDLDILLPKTKTTIPDFALIDGESCLLIEVKLTLLKIDARTYFDSKDIKSQATSGNIKKAVEQLSEFSTQIYSGNLAKNAFVGVKKIVKLVIGFDDIFTSNAELLPIIDENYIDTFSSSLQFGTISDIEAIAGGLAHGEPILNLLLEKAEDKQKRLHSIKNELQIANIPCHSPLLNDAFDALINMIGVT